MPSLDDDVPTLSRSTHLLRGAQRSPAYTAKYTKRSYLNRHRQPAGRLSKCGPPCALKKGGAWLYKVQRNQGDIS
jgi:hypothetical protein